MEQLKSKWRYLRGQVTRLLKKVGELNADADHVEIGAMMHSELASKVERLGEVDNLLNNEGEERGDKEVEQDYDYILDLKMKMTTLSKSII